MKQQAQNIAHFLSRNILSTSAVIALMGVAAFAAAPNGGYAPGATLDPDCSPGDTDCSVVFSQDPNKFVDGATATDAVFTGGNVGIGTTDPTRALHVTGNSYAHWGQFNSDSSLGWLNVNTTNLNPAFVAFKDGSEIFRVDSTGNVGIGTTTPTQKLEVIGGSIETNRYLRIRAWDDDAATYGTGTGPIWYQGTGGSSTNTEDSIYIGDSGNDTNLTVKGSIIAGSMGRNPTSKLHINGIQAFNNRADAIAGGLTSGAVYRTGDFLKIVY